MLILVLAAALGQSTPVADQLEAMIGNAQGEAVIPPGEYRLERSVALPLRPGERPFSIRGYGATLNSISGDPCLVRWDGVGVGEGGSRDSCTGWKIEGLRFTGSGPGIKIRQARQLEITKCNFRGSAGAHFEFVLAANVNQCTFGSSIRTTGLYLGNKPAHSNMTRVEHCRFFGTGDHLVLDGVSAGVVDQCSFEGRGVSRCIVWEGDSSSITRNLHLRNCYWEVSGGPEVAAIWLNNLQAPSLIIEQPEAHPGGVGDVWTFLYGGRGCVNACVEIRNPTVLHGKFDCERPNTDANRGIRTLIVTWPQHNTRLEDSALWIGQRRGVFIGEDYIRRYRRDELVEQHRHK